MKYGFWMRVVGSHRGAVEALVFVGEALVSAGRDGRVVAWSLGGAAPRVLDELRPEGRDIWHRLAASSDGETLLAGSTGGGVAVVPLDGSMPITRELGVEQVTSVALAGSLAAIAGTHRCRTVLAPLSALPSGATVARVETYKPAYAAAFSPSGRRLALAAWDGSLSIAEVEGLAAQGATPLLDGVPLPWVGMPAFDACFLDEDRVIVGGASDDGGWIVAWSIAHARGQVLATTGDGVHTVRASPDGAWLAAAGNDATIRLFRGDDLALVGRLQLAEVSRVPFVYDDDALVRSARRRGIQVEGFEQVTQPSARDDDEYPSVYGYYSAAGPHSVHALAFSPDSATLAVGTQGGEVLVTHVASIGPG